MAGRSWRERTVGEEGNAGSVQRFWFDSPEHGELIVDAGKTATSGRYLSYESETGGDSWRLSSSGDRPAGAAARARDCRGSELANPGGEGWQRLSDREAGDNSWYPVASFLIETANCKIDPGQPVEPKP